MDASALPLAWRDALGRRRHHFSFDSEETLRLLHDEDPRVRCDRFGSVCWFYWYGSAPPDPEDLAHVERFTVEAGSTSWRMRQMRDRGRDPKALREWGNSPEEWIAAEGGLRYIFRGDHGLSPGLFLDQRPNRRWLQTQVRDRRVLNLFSYTGGFGLNAMSGGAQEIVNIDTSRPTLDWSQANFELNGLAGPGVEFWKAEARYFLRGCKNRGRAFDLVVCDPPSFSRSREGTFKIERDLGETLRAIDQVLVPDGLIFVATNFEKWNQDDFATQVQSALPGYALLALPPPDPDFASTRDTLMKALCLAKP